MRLYTVRAITDALIEAIEKKWDGAIRGTNRPKHPAHICVVKTYREILKVRDDYKAVNKLLAEASYVWESELGPKFPRLSAPKPHPVNPFGSMEIVPPRCPECKKEVPSLVIFHQTEIYRDGELYGTVDDGLALCGNCILHALKVHDGEAQS